MHTAAAVWMTNKVDVSITSITYCWMKFFLVNRATSTIASIFAISSQYASDAVFARIHCSCRNRRAISLRASDWMTVAALSGVWTNGGGGITGSSGPRASAFESRFRFFFPFGFVISRIPGVDGKQIAQQQHK